MRVALTRGLAALMATVVVFSTATTAIGAPADVFSSPAPVAGGELAKAADLRAGEASVSTQTGAMQYSYPISLPPGRGGMVPQVSLNYSSQAALYGTVASGWSLSIPMILEDTSQGRLRTHAPEVDAAIGPAAALLDDRYISTMAGNRPLVQVPEPIGSNAVQGYRAQNDTSFTRYERLNGSVVAGATAYWRAYTSSGTVLTFGDTSRMGTCQNVGFGYAPLTGEIDPFGNEVIYEWEWPSLAGGPPVGECRIKQITWGMNANAGVGAIAKIAFGWSAPTLTSTSPPMFVGAQRDYRTGRLRTTGASKLSTLTVTAFPSATPGSPDHTRVITLGYDAATEQTTGVLTHAPYRLLKSIQESAWRTGQAHVDLPPVSFQYGPPLTTGVQYQTAAPPWIALGHSKSLAWGYRRPNPNDDRWATVEAMMVDLDGDGLLDRLINASSNTTCAAQWQRNQGPIPGDPAKKLQFDPVLRNISLPQLKWGGVVSGASTPSASAARKEGCALNGQSTAYFNSSPISNLCHDGNLCVASTDPERTGTNYCNRLPTPVNGPTGTVCPLDPGGGGNTGYTSYVAYRFLDGDGDGLTDLVAAVHGDSDYYDIELGNAAPVPQEPLPFNLPSWPACPGVKLCKDLGNCLGERPFCAPGTLCPTDWTAFWTAVNSCLTSHAAVGCFAITARMPAAVALGPLQRSPYTRCEGLYPWFIFKNQGAGVFATTPTVKYQPVPLESDQGDSGLTGTSIFAENHAVADFDGDGWLDGIAHGEQTPNGNPNAWYVWLGDGTGGMGPTRYFFPTRNHAGTSNNNMISAADTSHLGQRMGTLDLNGDGLPDHWLDNGTTSSSTANISFHDGTSFEIWGTSIGPTGELDTPAGVKPTSILVTTPTNITVAGTAITTNRPVDVDNDGRIDIVKNTGAVTSDVFFNFGGQFFSTGSPHPADVSGVTATLRKITGSAPTVFDSPNETHVWELNADLVDLDGDGIAEPVFSDGTAFSRVPPTMTTPPRFMYAIDNGRGARSTITYASMHDSTVVEQNPCVVGMSNCPSTPPPPAAWFDGRPKATSSEQWVVKSITVEDDFDQFAAGTGTTTSYVYRNPRQGPDDANHVAFRGFETVETTAHSGAKTIQTFGYNIDWSGRLVKTVVKSAEQPTAAVSIDTTKYKDYSLFGGLVTTYHVIESEHFTCADNQAEATCLTTPPGYTKAISNIAPKASDTLAGPDLMLLETSVRTQHALSGAGEGDRQVDRTFVLASDGSTYRLRADMVTNSSQVSGAMVIYAKARTTWDTTAPAYARKLTDQVWVDGVDANRSVTNYGYDAVTGNLDHVISPRGYLTTYEYDARKLFVSAENNPMYTHNLEFDYEYGTGAKLEIRGPNIAFCLQTNPPNCTGQIARDTNRVVVDGLGRPIERWESVNPDPAVNAFALKKVEMTSYVDTPVGTSVPTSVTHQAAYKEVAGVTSYTQDKTELDGHGRPTRSIAYAFGAAPDSITTYRYRLDGTLQDVTMPDPTVNTTATTTYTYTFDSLGRALTMRRPQLAGDTAPTGVNISYNGLTKIVAEEAPTGTAGGSRASTKTTVDADGRLVRIEEGTVAPGASTPYAATNYVATNYAYFPDGGVKQITDPATKITTMTRDLAGHRTSVTRGGRTWRYAYDPGGNLLAETAPCDPTPACDVAYTTTFTYDTLDRPYLKWIARRGLSNADLDLFGAFQEATLWDVGANDRGRVSQTVSLGFTGAEVLRSWNVHDPQGRTLMHWQSFNIPGFSQVRATQYTYLLGGRPDTVSYNDNGNGATAITKSKVAYDARGLPTTVSISTNSGSTWQDTIESRNVAGLVTNRKTTITGLPFVESAWTYDKLGRVLDQKVNKGTTQLARQQLTYFGNDDPKTLITSFGTTAKPTQTFGYDFQHQLKTIIGNATYFGATYAYNVAGRFSAAQETGTPPSGSEVKARNVNYNYAGPDPEQVTSLTNVTGGATLESYTYDPSGNQLTRTEPSTGFSWTYLYDGENQLRRATKKLGAAVVGSEEYWYDGGGNRTHLVKRDAAGVKTETIWFLDGTEAHYTATNTVSHVYSNISLGTPVARTDRTNDTTITTEYQFHGLAGSTLIAVDKGGTINATFHYAPFGELIESTNAGGATNGTAAHKRRFNDKQQDDLTTLTYYGARYYDKLLMGWTQADPLYLRVPDLGKQSTPRRSNLAVFSLNNPVRYLDPDGRDVSLGNPLDPFKDERERQRDGDLTVTQQVHSLVARLRHGDNGVQLRKLHKVGADTTMISKDIDWKDPKILEFVKLLTGVLTKSESVRVMFGRMLSSSHRSALVVLDKGPSFTSQIGGDTPDSTNGTGAGALIFFNPTDLGNIMLGGSRGVSHKGPEDPEAGLAHELYHGWEVQTGQWGGGTWAEVRAVRFENTFRLQANMPSRDCYFLCDE